MKLYQTNPVLTQLHHYLMLKSSREKIQEQLSKLKNEQCPSAQQFLEKFGSLKNLDQDKHTLAMKLYLERDLLSQDIVNRPMQALELIFIFHNVRSAYHLGNFLRLSDCLNLKKVYFTGYTCQGDHPKVLKTSLGAESRTHWENQLELEDVLKAYSDYEVLAFEPHHNGEVLFDYSFREKSIFLFGNERFGLEQTSLDLAHRILEIPLRGVKSSLNISQACSIAGYEYLRQIRSSLA